MIEDTIIRPLYLSVLSSFGNSDHSGTITSHHGTEFQSECTRLFVEQKNVDITLRFMYITIAITSIVLLSSVSLTIYTIPQLRAHPSILIAWICIYQGLFAWQSFIQTPQVTAYYYICYFYLDGLFSSSTPFIDKDDSFITLLWCQEILFQFWQLLSLVTNVFFCYDLIQTLKNPFESTKGRFWTYILFSNVYSATLIGVMWVFSDQDVPTEYLDHETTKKHQPKYSINQLYNIILGLNLSVFMLVGFYSIILAYKRLVRPGVSIEMRKLFLRKHALYVVVLLVIWILSLLYNYQDLFNPYIILGRADQQNTFDTYDKHLRVISFLAMFSTGVVMVSIRVFDPYFRFIVAETFMQWFGIIKEKPEDGINTEVLSTFLSSSLNIELVYIILAGITKFSKSTSSQSQAGPKHLVNSAPDLKGISHVLKEQQQRALQAFNEEQQKNLEKVNPFEHIRTMTLNKIKISNARKWDVAKYDQFVSQGTKEFNDFQSVRESKQSVHQQSVRGSVRQSLQHSGQRLSSQVSRRVSVRNQLVRGIKQGLLISDDQGKHDQHQIINEDVKISDFAYSKFQELREIDGINHDQIMSSLSTSTNNKAVFKAGESQGKSGSFFFFSHDRKFIIKTMFTEELSIMMENLESYFEHIKSNPQSLIARIYGLFQVEMEGITPVYLLLMANTIQNISKHNKIEKVYDLKGSWANRIIGKNENQTMKDRNFLSCKNKRFLENRKGLVQFNQKDIKNLKAIVESDSKFMREMKFMDYSLLLAVEKINQKPEGGGGTTTSKQSVVHQMRQIIETEAKNRHRFFSTCGNYVYHIAIIDYLTQFTFSKKLESFYKVTIKNQKAEQVSCVHSELYGKRFLNFMNKEVFINEDIKRQQEMSLDQDQMKDQLFNFLKQEFDLQYQEQEARSIISSSSGVDTEN